MNGIAGVDPVATLPNTTAETSPVRWLSLVAKERELEIGHPTDVKHVAHIGWDGPSGNGTPGWMNEFKRASDFTMPVLEKSKAQRKQKCRKSKSVSSSSSRVGKTTKSKYGEVGQIPSLQTEGVCNHSKHVSMTRKPLAICIA